MGNTRLPDSACISTRQDNIKMEAKEKEPRKGSRGDALLLMTGMESVVVGFFSYR